MAPPSEFVPVTERHDVYPAISPEPHFANKTFKGKVVFLAGASKGIGREIATFYAKAGASVTVTARQQKPLDELRTDILRQVPNAQVLTVSVDVTKIKDVEAAVKATVETFGKLDIALANAGAIGRGERLLAEEDPDEWWGVMEVNIRGVYNVAHTTLPHLVKTKGYFFATASLASQQRVPKFSSYQLSKHALNRLIELIALEYPDVKVFALHPGLVKTDLSLKNAERGGYLDWLVDTPQLAAATALYLSAGKADWLCGRFVMSTWDLEELERNWKSKILDEEALINRLAVPS
ncbi:hypothetical protein EWM64_g3943 [Hericium alpestre]|uniref:NAD-P-binding protein n=1 Tax=Hericium alpestre TaxID=135208 RepID=A0A4Y9ZYU1_9AGAM|nr:hypothetical protein EWM64_g3943 [Hericium alpestre]